MISTGSIEKSVVGFGKVFFLNSNSFITNFQNSNSSKKFWAESNSYSIQPYFQSMLLLYPIRCRFFVSSEVVTVVGYLRLNQTINLNFSSILEHLKIIKIKFHII